MIKHFLSLANFSSTHISGLLDRAQFFSLHHNQPELLPPLLKNKIVVNAFYEPSTRTRCSFEVAVKRLGGEVVNFTPENSSVKKGESVYDTLKSLESLGVNAIVLRHSDDQIFDGLKDRLSIPLINAGAGKHEHPSQGLLDLLTLKQEFGELKGLKVAVCGDVKHSRVAGSLLVAAEKYGMQIYLCGPEELLPDAKLPYAQKANFDEVLPEVDAVMMLRIQLERHENLELDAKTYRQHFGLHLSRVEKMKSTAIVMHPGPFNRGVEISDDVVEHARSRIFKQVKNGVYARMAILEWALAGGLK